MGRRKEPNINETYFKDLKGFIRPTDVEINALLNLVNDMNSLEKERNLQTTITHKMTVNISNKKKKIYELVDLLKKVNKMRGKQK